MKTLPDFWCGLCGRTVKNDDKYPCDINGSMPPACPTKMHAIAIVQADQAAQQEDAAHAAPDMDTLLYDEPIQAPKGRTAPPICSADGCHRTKSCGPFCRDNGNLYDQPMQATSEDPFDRGRWSPVLPDDNPKTLIGLSKPALSPIPPVAILQLGQAMTDGRRKYGAMNWREKPVSATIYYDAALRHLMSWFDGEEVADDSGVHHLAHAMACCAILLDAKASGVLNDDRPYPGKFSEVSKALTKKVA